MNPKRMVRAPLSFGAVLLLGAASLPHPASAAEHYLLVAPHWGARQTAAVEAAGGTLRWTHGPSGLGVVTAEDPAFVDRVLAGGEFQAGMADRVLEWVAPGPVTSAVTPSDDPFLPLQWNLLAVEAPAAWAAACTGAGARVAIVDGGIDADHPDLVANLDAACSTSFVPGQGFDQDVGPFWHGTHVAGVVAAADNGIGIVGVAPEATLVGVKVLHGGAGSFAAVVAGILYAADPAGFGAPGCAPAHVVNLSLGALVPRTGNGALLAALTRAVDFATSRGALVVAAAGGDELDLGQAGDLVVVPAQSGKALAVSATGPVGFALGATDFRRIASYTNFGEDLVYVAGPGGDFVLPGSATCTVAGVTAACWVFDLVLSTNVGGSYAFASGTSPAAAAVSGIAALDLSGHPDTSRGALETLLARTADDEGKPGHDELYGHGFANAFRACVE